MKRLAIDISDDLHHRKHRVFYFGETRQLLTQLLEAALLYIIDDERCKQDVLQGKVKLVLKDEFKQAPLEFQSPGPYATVELDSSGAPKPNPAEG